MLKGFQQVAIEVLQLFGNDGHIEQRLAVNRDPVLVAAVTHRLDVAISIESLNQATETTCALLAHKNLLQIECKPTVWRD